MFKTVSDDGIRVCVDSTGTPCTGGTYVINNWADHSATTNQGSLVLASGSHPVTVEYYEHLGVAVAQLTITSSVAVATTTTVTSSRNPSVYGSPVTFTATVSPSVATGTVTFGDGARSIGTGTLNSVGVATFTTSALTAGAHSITAVYGGDSVFIGSTSPLISQTVTPKALTITASNQSKTYGTSLVLGTTLFTPSGLVNGDTVTGVTLTSGGTGATATVGTYLITPSAATGPAVANYTITYANGTLTVTKAALTITAGNQTKTYGTTLSLGTSAFTPIGLVNSDSVSSVTLSSAAAGASATVGTYPITPSAASGSGLANYAISYVNGMLTVTPKALTITATNRSKTYGSSLALGTTAFTTSGLVNGNTVSSVTLTSAGTAASAPVGTYPIFPSAASGSGLSNYTIGYVNGTLTVKR
jgi:hypothetical protein